jgi:hypothetical protein
MRVESVSFTTRRGFVISSVYPWFRVQGDRSVYRFVRHVTQTIRGRMRFRVEAIGPNGEFRAMNVGRPYRSNGVRVPQYLPRLARRPKEVR